MEIKESGKVGTIVHVFDGGYYPFLVSFDLSKFTFNGYREDDGTLTPYVYDVYLGAGEFHEFCNNNELIMVEPFDDTKENDKS